MLFRISVDTVDAAAAKSRAGKAIDATQHADEMGVDVTKDAAQKTGEKTKEIAGATAKKTKEVASATGEAITGFAPCGPTVSVANSSHRSALACSLAASPEVSKPLSLEEYFSAPADMRMAF